MAILNKVGILITPNAVNHQKVYSIIPEDGSGDLRVIRSSNAFVTKSNGFLAYLLVLALAGRLKTVTLLLLMEVLE